jgi:hypothetical protein
MAGFQVSTEAHTQRALTGTRAYAPAIAIAPIAVTTEERRAVGSQAGRRRRLVTSPTAPAFRRDG